ncbi:hypothetical protein GLW08_12740 [Pontibacillus yanchengensis]|uniref:Uncharacterized protein n=1 Tax=Pontibacillus yanchengensis TaxID=462910 RepID=A0ACC7VGV7_9BACI|nr:hypothetical protein [Pontibacillus yanchengensis]MYL54203.1 hypothetical protein [Pontibacillus yanchengensis]
MLVAGARNGRIVCSFLLKKAIIRLFSMEKKIKKNCFYVLHHKKQRGILLYVALRAATKTH